MTYLERYERNEYAQVWGDLLVLGEAVRQEPIYSDALAVVQATMRRAKTNIETIIDRLKNVGYKFSPEAPALEPASSAMLERLASLEQQAGGPLPMSLRVFYEVVGAVRLYGLHGDLGINLAGYEDGVDDTEWFDSLTEVETAFYYGESRPPVSDPLVVDFPFSSAIEDYRYNFDPSRYHLDIAPDAWHKADISGGGPYMLAFPSLAIDEHVEGTITNIKLTFVEYLREVFRWGGFPGFKDINNAPTELLSFLAKDLLPL